MPHIEQTAACFQDHNGQATPAHLHTTVYDARDRLQRALLKLGLFWLLAVGSIPIIFAHWVLVPGFFLAGPWMAWRTYQLTRVCTHVTGTCPTCQAAVEIKLEAKDSLPKWSYCPACQASLQITSTTE